MVGGAEFIGSGFAEWCDFCGAWCLNAGVGLLLCVGMSMVSMVC